MSKTGREIKGERVVFNDDGSYSPVAEGRQADTKPASSVKCQWVAFRYLDQLELARQTRNALLAVQAELHRMHFRAWDKKAPIAFGNSTLRGLGFSHHEKTRALKALETAGWITVQWHGKKTPRVTIIQGFHHGL